MRYRQKNVENKDNQPRMFEGHLPEPKTSPNGDDKPIFGARYTLHSKLGAGGMGAVYQAHDKVLNKTVAVKVLLSNLQAEAMIRFHQEAKTTARLSHKNILNVLDFGQNESGELYLVMDFLDGQSLADLLKANGPLNPALAVPIFCQICQGLAHAHSQGILHRDIKPSNVMLVDDGRGYMQAKIVDFGLAKMEASEQSLTTTGARVGSPLYMSPEQCHGHEVDHRSDIYSFGILMYRTLTGAVPFQGESYLDTLSKHVHEEPKDINENDRALEFSPELSAIVSKSLAKDPDQRYQTCEELLAGLQSLELAVLKPKVEEEPNEAELLFDTVRSAREKRTRKLWIAGISAATVVLAGGTLYVMSTFQSLDEGEVRVAPKKERESILRGLVSDGSIRYPEDGKRWIRLLESFSDDSVEDMLKENRTMRNFNFTNSGVTGANLSLLAANKPENLDLSCTAVGDKGMTEVAKLRTLQGLWLNGLVITDAALEPLVSLPKLKELGMRNTDITDRGLQLISEMQGLEILDISDCQKVSGKGLDALKACKSLHTLQLNNCSGIGEKSIERFRAATGIHTILTRPTLHEKRLGWRHADFRHGHEERHEGGSMAFMGDMRDPDFQKFWQNPKNWDLKKDEIAKLPPKIKKYFDNPKYAEYRKNPKVRAKWTNPKEWQKMQRFTDIISKTAISSDLEPGLEKSGEPGKPSESPFDMFHDLPADQ